MNKVLKTINIIVRIILTIAVSLTIFVFCYIKVVNINHNISNVDIEVLNKRNRTEKVGNSTIYYVDITYLYRNNNPIAIYEIDYTNIVRTRSDNEVMDLDISYGLMLRVAGGGPAPIPSNGYITSTVSIQKWDYQVDDDFATLYNSGLNDLIFDYRINKLYFTDGKTIPVDIKELLSMIAFLVMSIVCGLCGSASIGIPGTNQDDYKEFERASKLHDSYLRQGLTQDAIRTKGQMDRAMARIAARNNGSRSAYDAYRSFEKASRFYDSYATQGLTQDVARTKGQMDRAMAEIMSKK